MNEEIVLRKLLTINKVTELKNLGTVAYKNKLGKPAGDNTAEFGRRIKTTYFHKIRKPYFFSDKARFTLGRD